MPCDAACQAKILLNGERVAREAKASVRIAKHLSDLGMLSDAAGQQLIDILDRTEDELIAWNDRRLASTGYVRKTQVFKLKKLEEDK